MISYKVVLTTVIASGLLLAGCSFSERVTYYPTINQGNYMTNDEVAQLKVGMTKQQVTFLLGTPMLVSAFDDNDWYYVYRKQTGAKIEQKKIMLTFDSANQLRTIDHVDN